MCKITCVAALLLLARPLFGQPFYSFPSFASSRTAVVFGFSSHPALLARQQGVTAGILGEKKYGLQDLGIYRAGLVLPAGGRSAFGCTADREGSSNFHRSDLSVSYGRPLGEKLDLGIGFHYASISFSGAYGRSNALYPSLSAALQVAPDFRSCITVSNPLSLRDGKAEDPFGGLLSLGFSFQPSPLFSAAFWLVKKQSGAAAALLSLEYRPLPDLFLQMGFHAGQSAPWLSVGWQRKQFRIDVAASWQPLPGLSPLSMVHYSFPPKNR